MTDSNSADKAVSDRTINRAGTFGFDQHGRKHMFDSARSQIFVMDGDGVEHVEQLARERVPHWIQFIDGRRGWIDQWWACEDPIEAGRRRRDAEAQAADELYQAAIDDAQEEAAQ